jgi:hypothetical protein
VLLSVDQAPLAGLAPSSASPPDRGVRFQAENWPGG